MKTLLATIFAVFAVTAANAAAPVKVASFSTILTEIATQVGGDKVEVAGLVKPGVDPHEYEPSPADLKQVGQAQLILASGKHLENYATKLQESAGPNAVFIQVGDAFPSLKMTEDDKVIEDPHWWNNINNTEKAVAVVRDALIKMDPADKETFSKNAETYLAKLDVLEKWAKAKVAELPRDQRTLVTSHDAFQYFAKEFGFTVHAIEGVSTQDEASSKKVADLLKTIREQHVKAVFFENIENPKVLAEITKETGAKIGGELYADGLGDGEGATYEGMFRHNVTTIVDSLK